MSVCLCVSNCLSITIHTRLCEALVCVRVCACTQAITVSLIHTHTHTHTPCVSHTNTHTYTHLTPIKSELWPFPVISTPINPISSHRYQRQQYDHYYITRGDITNTNTCNLVHMSYLRAYQIHGCKQTCIIQEAAVNTTNTPVPQLELTNTYKYPYIMRHDTGQVSIRMQYWLFAKIKYTYKNINIITGGRIYAFVRLCIYSATTKRCVLQTAPWRVKIDEIHIRMYTFYSVPVHLLIHLT